MLRLPADMKNFGNTTNATTDIAEGIRTVLCFILVVTLLGLVFYVAAAAPRPDDIPEIVKAEVAK